MRVAVLGAPGPAARSERVASGGRGLKRFDNDCGMWTCGLLWFTKSTVIESHTAPFCVYVLGTVASDGPATTRRATASATTDRTGRY